MWLTIIGAITSFLPIAQKIGALWQSSAGFAKIGEEVASAAPSALKMIDEFAAQMWPAAEKKVQQVLGALHLWAPQSTRWVQQALNAAQDGVHPLRRSVGRGWHFRQQDICRYRDPSEQTRPENHWRGDGP